MCFPESRARRLAFGRLLEIAETGYLRHVLGFLTRMDREHLHPNDFLKGHGDHEGSNLVMLVHRFTLEYQVRFAGNLRKLLYLVAEAVPKVNQSAKFKFRLKSPHLGIGIECRFVAIAEVAESAPLAGYQALVLIGWPVKPIVIKHCSS